MGKHRWMRSVRLQNSNDLPREVIAYRSSNDIADRLIRSQGTWSPISAHRPNVNGNSLRRDAKDVSLYTVQGQADVRSPPWLVGQV